MLKLQELQEKINHIVIGQEEAVKQLSTLIYKFFLKKAMKDKGIFFDDVTTALIKGKTGVGKTYLVKTIADILRLPLIEINCKSISQEGWHGKSFKELVVDSIREFRFSYGSVSSGIILLDEFDKIMQPCISSGGTNVNYEIQTGLLKYLEGFQINQDGYNINLKNFVVLFAGAFQDLEIKKTRTIGFDAETQQPSYTKALIDYGMLPEIAGRIQEVIELEEIDDAYKEILKSEEFCYYKYQELFKLFGLDFQVESSIVLEKTKELDLGVRGMIRIIEEESTKLINNNLDLIDLEVFSPLYVKPKRDIT